MASPASYKPLSFASPQRASPFRRPESPASPSPLRNSTAPITTQNAVIAARNAAAPTKLFSISHTAPESPVLPQPLPTTTSPSPPKSQESFTTVQRSTGQGRSSKYSLMDTSDSDAISRLLPAQVRELREGFQLLDRDSDGLVNVEDVVDMLTQLGLPANSSDLSKFFPKGQTQNIALPTFLTQISTLQAALSPPAELLSAFSAFDDDDSGQVDLKELRDALLHTAPDPGDNALTEREVDRILNSFSGRRTLGKKSDFANQKRGETFKYEAFVGAISGTSSAEKENEQ